MIIAGVDEAGRGPLAGPVVAACVLFPLNGPYPKGLNDSKKLSKSKRQELFEQIHEMALFLAFSVIDEKTIDKINILQASLLAMKYAVLEVDKKYKLNKILIDGKFTIKDLDSEIEQEAIVGGDSLEKSIMAASIIAKVHRDRLMESYHQKYPLYGFNRHMGYGTKAHMEAIFSLGPCPIHRMSFAPLKNL